MTESNLMTNEEFLDFLVLTGKQALEFMTSQGEDFQPTIVHQAVDGDLRVILLGGGLGENDELLVEGLVVAAAHPQAMISFTADVYMSLALPAYGVGNRGRVGIGRPSEAFAQGDPNTSEALRIVAVFVGEDDIHEIDLPYKREGATIVWGAEKRQVVESRIGGAIRTAMVASHARMS